MLLELRINNVAIIDQMALTFAPGLNVLTGETGAGKSIISRAVGLLCGGRASVDLIRTDAEEAEIEGLFRADAGVRARLEELGLPAEDEIVVRRVINRSGKGRVHIGGRLSTATILGQLGERLIHFYGQHDYALLLEPESHLAFLDEFGAHAAEREAMAVAHAAYREIADRLVAARRGVASRVERADLLRYQAEELGRANPARGEESALQIERERLRHAEKLAGICRNADAALSSETDAVANVLARIATTLEDAGRIDPEIGARAATLRDALAAVEDVALDLRRSGERIEHDPERLEQIEERLALLSRLKRKYRCDADELADALVAIEGELATIGLSDADIEALEAERRGRAAEAWRRARELSARRQQAARALEGALTDELASLGMAGAVFSVVFHTADAAESDDRLGARGADDVEFYFSANPGEEQRPLARIASGGELSRIMLALKALTAGAGEVGTLIFDEVDTGIGGTTAEAVGERLHALGHHRQVLSITHLPQIAARADHHLAISKEVRRGRTVTAACELGGDERVAEIARMLGAAGSTESEGYARRLMAGRREMGPTTGGTTRKAKS